MPQNSNMRLGQRGRFVAIFFVLAALSLGCQKAYDSVTLRLPENKDNPYAKAIASKNWKLVEDLSSSSPDGFVQLINMRALYELKKYSQVLQITPTEDPRFKSYMILLRDLSAYELKNWDVIISQGTPSDLPNNLQEKIENLRAQAFEEIGNHEEAKKIYEKMIVNFARGSLRADILSHLAKIYLNIGNTERALQLLEELYIQYPFDSDDSKTKKLLLEHNHLSKIELEKLLQRAAVLRKSALFSRAKKELDYLLQVSKENNLDPKYKLKIQLATAQVYFAEKKYSQVEKLARQVLKNKIPLDMEVEWRQILGSSLVRLDRGQEGIAEYQIVLQKKVPSSTREVMLYRIAMSHLDDEAYDKAAEKFRELRELPSASSYIESAYWFEAWSLMRLLKDNPDNPTVRAQVLKLLARLPDLPEGVPFSPQALYWESRADLNPESKEEKNKRLLNDWKVSFYSQLASKEPFKFLSITPNIKAPPPKPLNGDEEIPDAMREDLSWQRLELFRAVNLKSWAQMELDQFLNSYRRKSRDAQVAVAKRLSHLGDWDTLVKWVERYIPKTLKELNLNDPSVQFYYPRAYETEVLKYAKEFKVSPFLVWGVMREESRFQAEIISWAGAIGLMQVMPFRGQKIAQSLGESLNGNEGLKDPKKNIRIGAYHLKEIEHQVDTLPVKDELKPILQIAVYNAGLEPVKKWIKERDTSSIDAFVESIPYGETRQYVKRVLQSAHIYYLLYQVTADDKKSEEKKTNETQ